MSLPTNFPEEPIIIVGFVTVLTLMVALTIIGLSGISAVNERMRVITEQYNVKTEIITSMHSIVRERSLSMYAMLHTNDIFEREDELVRFKNMAQDFMNKRSQLSSMELDEKETVLLERALNLIRTSQPLQVAIVDKIVGDEFTGQVDKMLNQDLPMEKDILSIFDKMVALERQAATVAVIEAGREFQYTFILMMVIGTAAITLGTVIAWFVVRWTGRIEDALFQEKERAQVTLHSIGDAVVTTNKGGKVIYMNPVAEQLTGWKSREAYGLPLKKIYNIVNEATSEPIDHPAITGDLDGGAVGMDRSSVLVGREGNEYAVEDTVTPMHDGAGNMMGRVLVFRDVSDARSLSQQLTWQASHDALTGLANRREFEILLSQMIASAKAQEKQHALLYLDLDQFKVVNDTCGHVAGDELLKQLAAILQPLIRDSDTLARLGGDEFGVLLEGCPMLKATRIAETLHKAVQEYRFVWQDKTFNIGVSIGLAAIDSGFADAASVLSAADAACYVAKDKGRNRIWVHQADDTEVIQRQGEMRWVSRITEAFEKNRFLLYKQSIIPLREKGVAPRHYELLIRMLDEHGGLIQPMAFIPAAERYGLMSAIDRWVVHRAFSWMTEQPSAVDGSCMVSINVSSQSLSDDHFLKYVVGQLDHLGVDPTCIWFEITETAAIANWQRAMEFISVLKERGCRFALDDFGSGMSSFAYLKGLPVDCVKMDGAFVKDMANDAIDLAVVEAINRIGQVMGKETIAESVESDAVLSKLRELGVDYAQGHGIHVPEPL